MSDSKKPIILIDTSPLSSLHATRGIGMYTRLLTSALEELPDIQLVRSSSASVPTKKPDLIHYPFFDFFFSTLPIGFSTPRIVTVHDVIPLKFPAYYKPGIRGRFSFARQKLVLKTVSAIITDSESSKTDITYHLGFPKNHIYVVPLAAHPQLKKASLESIKQVKSQLSLPDKYILYVGDINYNKNIPQLVKSLKYIPEDVSLVLVGSNFVKQSIPEWQWIETQIALSNVSNRVIFLPNVLHDDLETLSALYTGADCYVQPSLYEGFGLPILEAMQCKTPVVCSANSSLIEVGGESATFTGTSAEELAAGINEVLSWSKTKREAVINGAYNWSQKFSWTKAAAQTADIYRKVLGL